MMAVFSVKLNRIGNVKQQMIQISVISEATESENHLRLVMTEIRLMDEDVVLIVSLF